MSYLKRLLVFAVIFSGSLVCQQSRSWGQGDIIDFDILNILQCSDFDPLDDPEEFAICTIFQEFLIDDLLEAEAFIDSVFTGFRNDLPFFLRAQLPDKILIRVRLEMIDDVGGVLANASPGLEGFAFGPNDFARLIPNPFLRVRGGYRAWSIPRRGFMRIDIDDVPGLILTDGMVDTVVHECFHALGHPTAFDTPSTLTPLGNQVGSSLNGPTNIFGQVNFLGDRQGLNGVGFGLNEFRQESANPFAEFIPLSQHDGNAHLSTFEPAFNRPDEGLQEVFLAFAGGQGFMSRSLRGMFADLGFAIPGINFQGIIDVDGDGIDDDPLIVNPERPDDP